ncbi:MAG TPA: isoprenylcysteine carboxyl methyltransferase [Flavobacteriales bacterium]|nr:isoprenylcysteine carboxylmethyltransferase family protein [Flavobacteriales bacterium]HAW19470.1 isoprenylcysteine carboxyl methyltransferase [Flavobacteriales bacterium]
MKSILFVAIQFILLVAFLFTGPGLVDSWWILGLQAIAILIGLWALYTMKMHQFSVFPEPKNTLNICDQGPYRWIRHPMYSALLLLALGWTLDRFDLFHAGMFAGLLLNQILKLQYEERLLLQKFKEYSGYMEGTKRLIPFVY